MTANPSIVARRITSLSAIKLASAVPFQGREPFQSDRRRRANYGLLSVEYSGESGGHRIDYLDDCRDVVAWAPGPGSGVDMSRIMIGDRSRGERWRQRDATS